MLKTETFLTHLKQLGFNFFSGVPCSLLKDLINQVMNEGDYVAAVNEGDAVATCSGAYLGGKKAVVLLQNSGLGNAVSPLTSLNRPYGIPVLGFVSLRGEAGVEDNPQHSFMGSITSEMLTVMGIENAVLSFDMNDAISQLAHANSIIDSGKSFFFIVRHNTFTGVTLKESAALVRTSTAMSPIPMPIMNRAPVGTRLQTLETVLSAISNDAIVIATTGKTGRELFEMEDRPQFFYMVGSMGCASAIGLGLALACPEKRIIVLDGDGALLMRMGNLATNGFYAPANLCHILLDNGVHDSTGGQSTVSGYVDFAAIAAACGYNRIVNVNTRLTLDENIRYWEKDTDITFLYVPIKPGSKSPLGRPTVSMVDVTRRLKEFVKK